MQKTEKRRGSFMRVHREDAGRGDDALNWTVQGGPRSGPRAETVSFAEAQTSFSRNRSSPRSVASRFLSWRSAARNASRSTT